MRDASLINLCLPTRSWALSCAQPDNNKRFWLLHFTFLFCAVQLQLQLQSNSVLRVCKSLPSTSLLIPAEWYFCCYPKLEQQQQAGPLEWVKLVYNFKYESEFIFDQIMTEQIRSIAIVWKQNGCVSVLCVRVSDWVNENEENEREREWVRVREGWWNVEWIQSGKSKEMLRASDNALVCVLME